MRTTLLGCGSIGRRHIQNLLSLGYTDLIAFDPSTEARQKVEQDFGISTVAALDEAWQQRPEVVFVNAPPDTHIELALKAARLGCHLFIEKPLAHSLQGIDALEAEIKERQLVNMVACNMRFHPGPAQVKQLLEANVSGEIIAARLQFSSYLPRWRPWQDYRQSYTATTGAILDCIHEIDLALWYFGAAKVLASARLPAKSIGLEIDGLAEILLQHDSGVLTNIHLSFVQHDYYRTCQIIGSEGTIYWDFNDKQVKVYGNDGTLSQIFTQPEDWQLNQMYIDEVDHFMQAVRQGQETMNPIFGGIEALKIALDT